MSYLATEIKSSSLSAAKKVLLVASSACELALHTCFLNEDDQIDAQSCRDDNYLKLENSIAILGLGMQSAKWWSRSSAQFGSQTATPDT